MWKWSIRCKELMTDNQTIHEIAFSIGANLGNRLSALRYAYMRLQDAIPDLACSPVYETEPVGYLEQPSFLNCACKGTTSLPIDEILSLIHIIHAELHRKSRPQWHEREIDVDILIYGSTIIESEQLNIPHPRMHQRAFVLQPLSDLAPSLIHPTYNLSILELLNRCDDKSGIILHCSAEELIQG
ncbi:MAG: 2-amino-4-hydroxy-6-hydroxymethyldihydropteridine diphosphokinase [Bacteroidetes bacterium]|nr:2-amino-4-hydroxy-6-hydroxymethyldihydropteridine diphosphokinase [bacterium]NBP63538.1 2-amino-4-hydroxy-6-hydroxymethyldihydropteridine diphosphokinase [Bacteroidota bacterium]